MINWLLMAMHKNFDFMKCALCLCQRCIGKGKNGGLSNLEV